MTKKQWYSHTMKWYSGIIMNELLKQQKVQRHVKQNMPVIYLQKELPLVINFIKYIHSIIYFLHIFYFRLQKNTSVIAS